MASIFREAVQEEVRDQPAWLRFKGSILIVATGAVGVASQLAVSPDLQGTRWATALTVVASTAAFLLNRFTKDGVTPSQASRLEEAANRVFERVPFETQPVSGSDAVVAPVVETPADQPAPVVDGGMADGEAARAQVEAERVRAAQS